MLWKNWNWVTFLEVLYDPRKRNSQIYKMTAKNQVSELGSSLLCWENLSAGSTSQSLLTGRKWSLIRLIIHQITSIFFNFSFCSQTVENILVRWLDRVPNCQPKFLRTASLTSLTILSGYNLSAKNTLKKNQDHTELKNKKISQKSDYSAFLLEKIISLLCHLKNENGM